MVVGGVIGGGWVGDWRWLCGPTGGGWVIGGGWWVFGGGWVIGGG